MRAWPRTVSSGFKNVEVLATELAPRGAQVLMGVRWSFGLPSPLASGFTEYSFPLNPTPFATALARRGGLAIIVHRGRGGSDLAAHLAAGRAAVVAVDSFYLPYRPAFGRVHSSRTIIVRQGRSADEVHVEDGWPPAYTGMLSVVDLERSRWSAVTEDVQREPVFSGCPIDGEWFSIEKSSVAVSELVMWAGELLGVLFREATQPVAISGTEFGVHALASLARRLDDADGWVTSTLRAASLLLRAELSARVYLCAFLRWASGSLGDGVLRREVDGYYDGLRHMEVARDVLVKSITHSRPEYRPYVVDQMRRAAGWEERLATVLAPYSDGAGS